MNEIKKGVLSLLLVVLIGVLGVVVFGNYKSYKEEQKALELAQQPELVLPDPEPVVPDASFTEPEAPIDVRLTFAGDIVAHSGLNEQAKREDGSYDYATVFGDLQNAISGADFAACTMETTFPNVTEYTGYPRFQSPAGLATSLKSIGFDLINTANNHSMDSWQSGLNRTLDVLDQNGLAHIGTYRSQEERDQNNGIVVQEINGLRFAFLSFTYGTNGIPVTGMEYAVNVFFNDYMTTLSDVNYERLAADMEAARNLDTDMIVVMMHWGNEYQTSPAKYQQELSDFLFQEGADLIIGGHPHVPEPMELRRVTDKEGKEKTGFIVYSLGNLISCQDDPYTRLTAVLDIDVQKNPETGETYLKHISYRPMYMVDLRDMGVSADWRYRLWNLQEAISAYEAGDSLAVMNDGFYGTLTANLQDLHSVLDPEFDFYLTGGVDVTDWTVKNS